MAIEEKIKEKIKELEAIRKITYTTEQGGRKSVKVDGFAMADGNKFFFVSGGNIVLFQAPTLHDLKKGRGELVSISHRETRIPERLLSRAENYYLTTTGKPVHIGGRYLYSVDRWHAYASKTGVLVKIYFAPDAIDISFARFTKQFPRVRNIRF